MLIKNKIILSIILIFFAFDLSAENYFIEIIGNDNTDTDVVYSLLENKPESLSSEYSNYLLKQLNQSGLFKNVRVEMNTERYIVYIEEYPNINKIFYEYGPFEGEVEGRKNGALISMEKGKAVAFAIFNLQARGEMFITHNDPVYPGMIVGLSPKPGDMIINVMKGKKLTNMRTQGTDENVVLTPVRKMSIAEQLSILNTDEALEITPESCRLRKAILDPHERKRSEKSGAAA